MSVLESRFQKKLMDEIRAMFPGCVILKNDAGYIQGFPDWTILYKDKWAVLETKRAKNAPKQPNQEYYVMQLNNMSFSRIVYPENKEEVLRELRQAFES
jgi:3-hydroxymyristoyl/3-hydroxydecanoyl-(acyl carrier protein) dehydratase